MKTIISLTIVLALSGCSLFAPTLDQRGIVKVEQKGSPPIRILNTVVYESSQGMVVRGTLKYPIFIKYGRFDGHVDVDVTMPTGERLTDHGVKVLRRNVSQKKGREAFFVTRFLIEPQQGTVVHVAYSDTNHDPAS